jgi:hypothetical protein
MTIRIDAEVSCNRCGTKARCTLDADDLRSRRFSTAGAAIRGLPNWHYKDYDGGNPARLACSEACMKVLAAEYDGYAGSWKPCLPEASGPR